MYHKETETYRAGLPANLFSTLALAYSRLEDAQAIRFSYRRCLAADYGIEVAMIAARLRWRTCLLGEAVF